MTVFRSAVVALGANLPSAAGTPVRTLIAAIAARAGAGLTVRAVSRFYATPCFPAGAGPDYVNAAVRIATALPPDRLLSALHEIEARFGRERRQRWGQRTLDLDLVCVGDTVWPDAATLRAWMDLPAADQRRQAPGGLLLPHPRLQDRAFVLVPMADVAPGWRHPLLDRTVPAMLAGLPQDDIATVRPI
jgi:2-amino-4-hydroxy-6-hydroxymethyldihydropteridine diphosphokinase